MWSGPLSCMWPKTSMASVKRPGWAGFQLMWRNISDETETFETVTSSEAIALRSRAAAASPSLSEVILPPQFRTPSRR